NLRQPITSTRTRGEDNLNLPKAGEVTAQLAVGGWESSGLPPGGPHCGLTSFRRRAIRNPSSPRRAAAITAAWNPATTPAATAEAGADAAGGGANAPATVRSTASPTGKPIRKEVLTTPEARPSSPGFVPATAAML